MPRNSMPINHAPPLRRGRPRRWLSLALAATIAAVPLGLATPALAAPKGPANAATLLADRAYPGIQLIQTDYTATVSVPKPTSNASAFKALGRRIALQTITGVIGSEKKDSQEAFVAAIEKSPFEYLVPTSSRSSEEASLTGVGTGWVATPDGYIVTAAHVVKADPEEIKQEFAVSTLKGLASATAKDLSKGTESFAFTTDQVERLTEAFTKWFARYLTVSNVKTEVSVQVGVATAGYKKSQRGEPVEVVSIGESYPGKDVAILKLNGQSQLPTLPLGTNADVAVGSTLHVAGYPAASTFYSGLSKDSEVQPTVTEGPLTAIKEGSNGAPIFQTQAPASPGNSGGPVLDNNGKVVGILVASAVDDKGVALEGQGFVIPASVITEKLKEKNITPKASETTRLYNEAVTEYYKRWYKRSLEKFEKVANLYPGHPYVGEFKANSQAKINAGEDDSPLPIWVWFFVGFSIFFLLLLIGLAVWLMRRSRQKKRRILEQQGQPYLGAQQYQQPGAPQQAQYPPTQYPPGAPPQQPYPGQPQAGPTQPPPPPPAEPLADRAPEAPEQQTGPQSKNPPNPWASPGTPT